MINAASLIQDLKALLDDCWVVEGLDEAVEYRSNKSRREATVEELDKIVQTVDEAYWRLALIPQLAGTFLVHSRNNAVGGTYISVEPDTNLGVGLNSPGEGRVDKVDRGVNRYTYYGEFGERVTRLREEILKGNLDRVLGYDPALILHTISGLGGELLPALGLDPFKGETFNKFANDPFQKTLRDLDANNEDKAKAMEEAGKAFQNFVKIILATSTKPSARTESSSNVIETTDYMVHPRTLTSEEVRGFGKLSEAKPAVKEIRFEKQLTYSRYEGETAKNEKRIVATPDKSDIAIGRPIGDPIGIVGFTVDDQVRGYMGLGGEIGGVLVIGILPNSLAEKNGQRAGAIPFDFGGEKGTLGGDIITGIGDMPIKSVEDLKQYISLYHNKGEKINFDVIRNGKQIEINLIY